MNKDVYNDNTIDWGKMRSGTKIGYDKESGDVVAKECTKCGELKYRKGFSKFSRDKSGLRSECKECGKKDREENKDRIAERDAKRYEKNKDHIKRTVAKYERKNPEKCAAKVAKRNAIKRNLPSEQIDIELFEICAVSGTTENVHLEHFVPLSVGHGGTIFENCYGLESSLNISKNGSHPFEWYERNKERFNIDPDAWNALIEDLAKRNEMTVEEFRKYVDWCFANPRTLDEIKADNERFGCTEEDIENGNAVDSVTLFREATERMAVQA